MDRPPPPPRSPKPYHLRSSRKQVPPSPFINLFTPLLDPRDLQSPSNTPPPHFQPLQEMANPAPTLGQLAALIATLRDDLTRVNADLEASRTREDAMAVTIAQLRDRTANTVQGNTTIVESQIVQATTKVSKPEVYSGKLEDTEKFLHQCDLFFTTLNYSDKEKITFALSYMKEGKALSFAQVFHEDWQSQTPPYGGTWTEFKQTSIRNMLGDSDRAATARLHIQDVKMGKGTAEEYIVSFQEHKILSKFGDVALVEAFKRGLNSSLLQRIYALPDHAHNPCGMEGMVKKARSPIPRGPDLPKGYSPRSRQQFQFFSPCRQGSECSFLLLFPCLHHHFSFPLSNKNPKLMLRSPSRERASVIFVDLLIIGQIGALNARRKDRTSALSLKMKLPLQLLQPNRRVFPKSIRITSTCSGFCK